MSGLTVKVPGVVWADFLDPRATEMQAELELPEPGRITRGRGWTAVYADVPVAVARELAEYLRDRGELLLSNSDPAYDGRERGWYRSALKVAETIDSDLRRAAN